jgi:hypothetical protein
MTHGFVQGSGHVLKREVYKQLGPIREGESFTGYCIRAAYHGWINGWYFPFIHEDHMDDARSPNYPVRTEEEFQKNLSLSQINFGVKSLADWQRFGRVLARHLQADIIDPRDHFGWRAWIKKIQSRVTGKRSFLEQHGHLVPTDTPPRQPS